MHSIVEGSNFNFRWQTIRISQDNFMSNISKIVPIIVNYSPELIFYPYGSLIFGDFLRK